MGMPHTGLTDDTATDATWLTQASRLMTGLLRAVLGVMVLGAAAIAGLLWLASDGQNRTALTASEATFGALLAAQTRGLERLAKDYTYWSEPIERVLGDLDPLWAKENLGSYVTATFNVDETMVIAGDGRPIIGASGSVDGVPDGTRLGDSAWAIIAAARAQPLRPTGPQPVSGFAIIDRTVHLMAVSRFMASEPGGAAPPDGGAVFLVARRVDPSVLALVRDDFGFHDLRLYGPETVPPAPAQVILSGPTGTPLGKIGWTPPMPGAALLHTMLPWVMVAVMVMGGLVTAVILRARAVTQALSAEAVARRKERRELHLHRQQVETLTAHAPVALFTTDALGRLTSLEGGPPSIRGDGPPPIGQPLGFVLGPDGARVEVDLERVATGETIDTEVRNGGRVLGLTMAPLRIDGRVDGVVGMITDLSDRRRAELSLQRTFDDLTRANAELERFVFVASHDLQEPVRTVVAFAQLLERRYADRFDDQGLDYLRFMIDGAKRMQTLVLDLLTYTRLGSADDTSVPVDVGDVLQAALATLQGEIHAAGAQVDLPSDLPLVLGDRRQITELFQCLLGNAVKFHRPGDAPVVTVRATDAGDDVEFSVSDNGIGVEPQYREQVFHLFKRLHSGSHYPGTGLGLAICRRIVERHGGAIWLQDSANGGTTVRFTLPKAYADGTAAASAAGP